MMVLLERNKIIRRMNLPKMDLVRRHNMSGAFSKLPTFFGYVSNPIDNDAYASTTGQTLFPPANMVAGDLVYMSMYVAASSRTCTITTTGGQSWTQTTDRTGATPCIFTAWCTFNGTWSANPVVTFSGAATSRSVQMFVFRAPKSNAVWAEDQPAGTPSFSASSTTHVITGITNIKPRNITIGRLILDTEGPLRTGISPSSWIGLGTNQYRNTGSNNHNATYAYLPQLIPGATGNLTFQLDVSDTGYRNMHSFYYT